MAECDGSGDGSEGRRKCAWCGERASKKCSACRSVYYCGGDHQKSHWPTHKKSCKKLGELKTGPRRGGSSSSDSSGSSVISGRCARCGERRDNGKPCRVEHPPHEMDTLSLFASAEGITEHWACAQCNRKFQKVFATYDAKRADRGEWRPADARWCYTGEHCTSVPKGDKRVTVTDAVRISEGSCANGHLRALSARTPAVRVLCLTAYAYEECKPYIVLDVKLPFLEILKIQEMPMERVHLSEELTPRLREFEMRNTPSSCVFDITVPTLRKLSMQHYDTSDCTWVQNMLRVANRLEEFTSYKFRVGSLKFHSDHLETVVLHRAERLMRLELHAPNLTNLSLQAAWDIEEVSILPRKGKNVRVVVTNAGIESKPRLLQTLRHHPRVTIVDESEDF